MADAPSSAGTLTAPELIYGPLAPEDRPQVDHLVTEDDTPVDNIYSEKQQRLLTESLYTSWRGPGAGSRFIALANVGLFTGINIPPDVPDVMVSLDVTLPVDIWEKGHRSYMLWEYGKPPEVVIEIVSNTVGGEDGTKLRHYARIPVTYYVIYDPQQQLSEHRLRLYERQPTGYVARQDCWLPGVELGLILWKGIFEDREDTWLRWCSPNGQMLLTGSEQAAQERLRAEQAQEQAVQERLRAEQAQEQAAQERLRAEQAQEQAAQERLRAEQAQEQAAQERLRAEQLAARLRALGIEPDV